MIKFKTECGKEGTLNIPKKVWDRLDQESKRNLMIGFLAENIDVWAYYEDGEFTGDCL